MKLPSFVYTRRWLVIMGLAATLACMVGVLIYVTYLRDNVKADTSSNQNESSSSAQESSNSATTKNKTNEIAPGSTASADLTKAAESTMQAVKVAIEAKDSQKLYDLLSSEMKAVFTEESVASAFAQADGLKISAIDVIRLNNEWAKQDVEGVDSAGKTMRFRVVLHLEEGKWKLYGTEQIS